jgi:hypothetical protein
MLGGADLYRCPPGIGDTVDILNCLSSDAFGASDNPRVLSGETLGARENYVVTIIFGNLWSVQAELFEDGVTPVGVARVGTTQDPRFSQTMGVLFSTVSGNGGSPVLGFDVEMAFTNVNNAIPDACARLHQFIVVESGSIRDGAGQGEDNNVLECTYVVPAGLEVTKACPPTPTAPGGLLVFTGTVHNTGQGPLTDVCVSNYVTGLTPQKVFGPTNLEPGQILAFTNSYVVPANYTNCSIFDGLYAFGFDCTNARITATNFATCPVRHTLTVTCPSNVTVQCLSDAPKPNPGSVIATSTAGGVIVTFVGDTRTTNGCTNIISRVYRATDACTNVQTCTQLILARDTIPPVLVGVPTNRTFQCLRDLPPTPAVTALDNCDTNVQVTLLKTTNGICPTIIVCRWTAADDCTNTAIAYATNTVWDTIPPVLVGVPTNRTFQCLRDVPASPAVTATDNCDTNVQVAVLKTTNGVCPTIIICRWTATDDCTNTAVAYATNTVWDTIPPVLVGVPTNRTYQCLRDVPPSPAVTATDNCDTNVQIAVLKTTNGVCPTIIICRWTATDDCTNTAVAYATNTVWDTIPPVLVGVPTNRTFQCLRDVGTSSTVTATDNCDTNITVTLLKTTNGICPTLVICRWTATDSCTNTATAYQTNTVWDTIPPVLVGVPTNRTYQCLRDVPATSPVTATDNCDTNVTVTLVKTTNGICPLIIVCHWTAVDDCTNSTSAFQTNTVFDAVPPVLVGLPTNRTFQCLSDVPPPATVTATDNCDTNIQVTRVSTTNGICRSSSFIAGLPPTSAPTRSWGIRRTPCAIPSPPILVGVPTNRTYQCLGDVPLPATVTATDNCDTNVQVTVSTLITGTCPRLVIYCWTATDNCTNQATACQTNTVRDTVPPTLVGLQ